MEWTLMIMMNLLNIRCEEEGSEILNKIILNVLGTCEEDS